MEINMTLAMLILAAAVFNIAMMLKFSGEGA